MTMRSRKDSIAKRETRNCITVYFFNNVIKLFKSKRVTKDKYFNFFIMSNLLCGYNTLIFFRRLLKKVYERNIRRIR